MKAHRSADKLAIIANQKVKERDYWQERLAGEPVSTSFPYEHKASSFGAGRENETDVVKKQFPPSLFDCLREMSGQSDYTLHVILTAAVVALLHKYTGHRDIMVGTPIYKQAVEGEFINTVLPLRLALQDKSTFKDLLMQTRQRMMEAVEHQSYPIEFLMNRMYKSQSEMGDELKLLDTALLLRNIQEEKDIAVVDPSITFSYLRSDCHLEVEACYRVSLNFYPEVKQVVQHLERLLDNVLENPDSGLNAVEILSPEEKNRLLVTFNQTFMDYPFDKTIHGIFAEQVEKTPDCIAVIGDRETGEAKARDVQVTYEELHHISGQLAHLLQEKGVRSDTIVALIIQRSVEMMTGILGILKAGGAYLPIDPQYPEERTAHMLADSRAQVVLAGRSYFQEVEKLKSLELETINIEECRGEPCVRPAGKTIVPGDTEPGVGARRAVPSEHAACSLKPETSPLNLAYVIYTSGSTGKPKGVTIKHHSLVNRLNWMQREYVLDKNDTILQKTPFTFDVSVWELLWWAMVGAKLCFLVPGGEKDTRAIAEAVEKNNITIMHFVPSMLNTFLDYVKITEAAKKLKTLRQVIASGEALTLSQVDLFNELLHKENSTKLANLYGPTEAAIDVSWFDCSTGETFAVIPIGKPIDNIEFYVLDRAMQLQPIGIAGELCIAGAGLARGYLNRPELTAEKFITAQAASCKPQAKEAGKSVVGARHAVPGDISNIPLCQHSIIPGVERSGTKLYRSGDLARWLSDGNIEFLGRIDHQVKIRGFRIELGEIENRLLKHEEIKDAVVIARDNENGDKYLSAYLVAPGEIPLLELREYLLNTLPDYMVPAYFTFLEQIPLTANGKVNRKALPEPDRKAGARYIAPRDEVENRLAEIWSEELGIEKEKIGINASFFELGGHSLRATRMIAKIHKQLGVNVTMEQVFNAPYIRELAERIKGMAAEEYASIEPVEKKEIYALSSAQKRLYILQQMERHGIGYNIPTCSMLAGEIDKDRLEHAFQRLIGRHESLRTSFQVVNEEPVQKIHDEVECEIEYFSTDHENTIKSFVLAFDLTRAPLFRVGIKEMPEDRSILMLDMHHIISDGTSEQILFHDFSDLYSGKELPKIRLQYKDYAGWQNGRKEGENLLKQKEYWKNEFKGELPVLSLPADYTRPAVQSFAGRTTGFELNEETGSALKALALETGATLFMVMLSLYTVFLSKLANQEDIVVGTPVAGRRHADLGKIIGMFLNTLTLRNFPSREKKFSSFLLEVKEKALKAFENQDYQYEDLVEQVAVNRDVSRNPLFDVMLIVQNFDTREIETPGLKLSPYQYESSTSKFDLTLYVMEFGNKLLFTFEYCTKIFSDETIERFAGFFKKVTADVLTDREKDIKISGIDIISAQEKEQILSDFNDTETGYPKDKTIHRLFAEQVEKTTDCIAVIGNRAASKKDVQVTYGELNRRSGQLAHLLREKGVVPDTIVGLMVERTVEMIMAIFGIFKAGGAYLPLDPGYPEERNVHMLADSRAKIVLNSRSGFQEVEKLRSLEVEIIDIEECRGEPCVPPSGKTIVPGDKEAGLKPVTGPLHLAYAIYTSGSTGKPKGVMIEHRSVVNFMQGIAAVIPFLPGKTILAVTTITFDIFVLETFLPLSQGLKIALASNRQQIDPDALEEIMVKYNVQMAQFTPSRLKLLLSDREDLEGLRQTGELMVGGEAFPDELFKDIKNRFKGRIFNMYGPTETTVWSTVKDLTKLDNINIGTPIINTQIYILDNSLKIQPVGVVGELYIGGDGLARGYLNRPELTVERFITAPVHNTQPRPAASASNIPLFRHSFIPTVERSEARLYRTGDLARWLPDGNIECLGRIDHQVKIRGFRIELGEIESRLLQYPDIDEAVVIDRENSEGKQYLGAYFVSKKNMGIAELKSILSNTLPGYMIPSYFIQVEKIPLTFNGKVDRKTLESYDIDMKTREEYAAPRNEIEQKIAETWKEVLKLERVGINENFFDLGGTSLDIIKLNAKFKETFQETDTVMQMFRYSTVRSFADYLTRKREGNVSDNNIDRSIPVSKIKKARQNQRHKRIRGGISNG